MPRLDAHDDFTRARRAHALARFGRRVSRRTHGHQPRALATCETAQTGPAYLEVVPLSEIVGTLEPTTLFDAQLRPASRSVGPRWRRVALAHRTGVPLPPIDVVRRADGYYVVDGRHRVSVARAHRHAYIEAWIHGDSATAQSPREAPSQPSPTGPQRTHRAVHPTGSTCTASLRPHATQ